MIDECDITPSAGARVRIIDAYIEAQDPNGDDVKITIMNSTLVSCATNCGMQIRAARPRLGACAGMRRDEDEGDKARSAARRRRIGRRA